MSTPAGRQSQQSFPDVARVDAYDKVRGVTRYAADDHPRNLAYAMLAVAHIGRGRVPGSIRDAARAVPGVELGPHAFEMTGVKAAGYLFGGGYAFQSLQPMLGRPSPIAASRSRSLRPTRSRQRSKLHRSSAPTRERAVHASRSTAPARRPSHQAESPLPRTGVRRQDRRR